ncbi:MAG: starch-binding protein, partial [Prevotella sp.]|nr:starch-binding protein [Prevotella sp.]
MKRKLLSILVLLLFVSGAYAQSTHTVYVKNEAGWENTYILYWDDFGDNDFPGTPMDNFYTDDMGHKFYKITIPIPNGINGILFNDGTFQKMADDITSNIEDG